MPRNRLNGRGRTLGKRGTIQKRPFISPQFSPRPRQRRRIRHRSNTSSPWQLRLSRRTRRSLRRRTRRHPIPHRRQRQSRNLLLLPAQKPLSRKVLLPWNLFINLNLLPPNGQHNTRLKPSPDHRTTHIPPGNILQINISITSRQHAVPVPRLILLRRRFAPFFFFPHLLAASRARESNTENHNKDLPQSIEISIIRQIHREVLPRVVKLTYISYLH